MARKGVLTQGTETWILHGSPAVLTKVSCIKTLDLGDENFDELDNNCLDNPDVPTSDFIPGKPADGSIVIDTDPANATHLLLLDLADSMDDFVLYVGWSDGNAAPTLTAGVVDLPDTRSWTSAMAKLRNSKPNFDPNSLVNHSLPLRRQSKIINEFKA